MEYEIFSKHIIHAHYTGKELLYVDKAVIDDDYIYVPVSEAVCFFLIVLLGNKVARVLLEGFP